MNYIPSVTQVLGVLRKVGLEMWFKQNSAEFCDAESNKGKEVGKIIHSVIQANIENQEIKFETEYPYEISTCLNGLAKFKKENPEIKFKRAEMEVENEKYGYIGHLDCLAQIGKKFLILDWKTGKCDVGRTDKYGRSKEKDVPPIYPEHQYQVSAYVAAYQEYTGTKIEQGAIVVFAKDKIAYNHLILTSSIMNEMFNQVFLPALSIYNYEKSIK